MNNPDYNFDFNNPFEEIKEPKVIKKMSNFDKTILKIEKFLKIERCYNCGKRIWWQSGRLRYFESPKDELGIIVPTCKSCLDYAERHQFDK
jgi:hypothetical protein